MHGVHTRSIPDIQKNAEFIMEHLNDPNFDLTQRPSFDVEEESAKRHIGEDGNGGINFEESVVFYPTPLNSHL